MSQALKSLKARLTQTPEDEILGKIQSVKDIIEVARAAGLEYLEIEAESELKRLARIYAGKVEKELTQ